MIITKNSNMKEEEIVKCLKKERIGISLLTDVSLSAPLSIKPRYYYVDIKENKTTKFECFCEKGIGKKLESHCPYCGNGIFRDSINLGTPSAIETYKKELVKVRAEINDYNKKNNTDYYTFSYCDYDEKIKLYDKFFIYKHPDYSYGIIIKKVLITAQATKEDICVTGKVERFIEIVPGKTCKAYKVKKSGNEEMDLFKAFNLSSNTTKNNVEIDYEDADNMLDFLDKNSDFAKRTGFKEVFNNDNGKTYKNAFFLFYMYAYCEYPVIEFLAKMGYTKIINEALSDIINSCNKEDMKKAADELTKVFNPYGTSGKLSLMIPKYMGDYLKDVNASYSDFEIWSDIYSYEKISKENFEKIILSNEFAKCYSNFECISNLLKYGYTLSKLLSYILKQSELTSNDTTSIVNCIKDYHNMMELMGVEADMYPSDIIDVHNKAVESYEAAKNKLNDDRILYLSKEASTLIPDDDTFTIVLPKNTTDFVREGERQHNCVASYVRSVVKNECYVFFVRKKEDIDKNYITAEYRKNSLYQIKEKNNYNVTNKNAVDYAKKFCEKLAKNKTFKSV